MSNNRLKKGDGVPFTQVPNEVLNHPEISLKAKGLYCFMLSKPDSWNFTALSMSKQLKESRKTILNCIKELKEFGLLTYQKNADGTGDYTIYTSLNPENSQSPKTAPCKNDTVQKQHPINNNNPSSNKDFNINPKSQGDREKSLRGRARARARLSLSKEVAEFKEKLIKTGYVGKCASNINVEMNFEDVYLNEKGRLYTESKKSSQILSSTLEEIWRQLYEYNEARKNKRDLLAN